MILLKVPGEDMNTPAKPSGNDDTAIIRRVSTTVSERRLSGGFPNRSLTTPAPLTSDFHGG